MSIPKVSVVIPVRNGKDYLQQALDSVLQQSFNDLELLLINDGSTDDDYDRYALEDARVRVIHLAGTGVAAARNVGTGQARGELIAFLDADDVWFPGKLAAQVRYMDSHPEVGVVFGSFLRWESGPDGAFAPAASLMTDCSGLEQPEAARSGWLYTRLLMGLLVGMNTAMVRRSVIDAIGGFNVSMQQGEDYDFWLKASRIAEMHALDGTVALYRIHKASAMHRLAPGNALTTLLQAAKLRWGLRGPTGEPLSEAVFERRLAQIHFGHGYAHFWDGSRSVARRSFYRAIRARYRPWRSAAYVVLCSLPEVIRKRLQQVAN
ncbi:glycosyltransferase family A protein [Hydrogenophaga sp.]|uniref:glycosyltransferase family 2 protein n=1 Tax=Hydrogenophaga sp. TaxID=1904254 RepID=UPI002721E7BF|nr:glycosyltransferase family A protein [Hydrogenophaga sp.]MDO9504988.1 glycosyltransferase family A protein [Hydrogenophaga sp.]